MFRFLKSYFSFTRSQQNGIIVLVLLIVVLIVVPYLIPLFVKQPEIDFSGFKQDIEAFEKQQSPEEKKITEPIELNSADSAQLLALDGIGTVLSKRIVKFRNVLGGFVTVSQLKEVYGLDSAKFQKIKPLLFVDTAAIKKIHINTASEEEMKIHPYFRKGVAGDICTFRKEHGPFTNVMHLTKLASVNNAVLQKIRPYITLE